MSSYKTTVAVVGATGYLGQYVCQALTKKGYEVRYLVRNARSLLDKGVSKEHIHEIDVTSAFSLKGQLAGVDTVISCLGITRQKDGLRYMDIDYQGNVNVLDEAKRAGIKKFMYVSVFKGDQFRQVALCNAKERFVDQLKLSGLDFCIVRPTGFFSDMKDIWDMANSGRVYQFGDGRQRLNPIHGKDLADAIVSTMTGEQTELNIGGPESFTMSEIADLAFDSINKKQSITSMPDFVRKIMLWLGKTFLSETKFGSVEFFLTLLGEDMVAPSYGERSLRAHFENLQALTAERPFSNHEVNP